jgi:flagellar hook-length control protein FliK
MPVATDAAPVAPLPAEGGIDAAHPVMPNRIDQHAAPLPQAQPVPPAAPDPAAAPVFAAAVTAATQPAGKDRDPAAPTDPLAAIAPAAATPSVVAVAPPSSGERSMLDLTQERWPQAMVAHIERLRDAADAADTRIRLVPDALGAIDIGVRQEGETLHVHFTAAEAQTRSLLQEAQPRLAEAAEQRGLKLGQTSVGQNQAEAGSGQRQPQPQPQSQSQHQAAPSPRPASPHRTASARDGDDDARLA